MNITSETLIPHDGKMRFAHATGEFRVDVDKYTPYSDDQLFLRVIRDQLVDARRAIDGDRAANPNTSELVRYVCVRAVVDEKWHATLHSVRALGNSTFRDIAGVEMHLTFAYDDAFETCFVCFRVHAATIDAVLDATIAHDLNYARVIAKRARRVDIERHAAILDMITLMVIAILWTRLNVLYFLGCAVIVAAAYFIMWDVRRDLQHERIGLYALYMRKNSDNV